MFSRDLDIFKHSLPDRHAWHHNDEFLKAVFFREFENRPKVNVGFSRSGFHLNGKMRAYSGGVGDRVYNLPSLKCRRRIGNINIVLKLDGSGIGVKLII